MQQFEITAIEKTLIEITSRPTTISRHGKIKYITAFPIIGNFFIQ